MTSDLTSSQSPIPRGRPAPPPEISREVHDSACSRLLIERLILGLPAHPPGDLRP